MNIHARARTTALIRDEIRLSVLTNNELAKKYNVHRHTIAKWKKRQDSQDKSHCPHHLQTTLSKAQESLVVALREILLLPLDDLLAITQEYINENASRSALDRCLRRHGVSNLKTMHRALQEASGEDQKKSFKDYAPGFIHVDVKYLPQMSDESRRSYLFVGIDRATRWVYLEIRKDKSALNASQFLETLIDKAPFKVTKVLTDNGKEFTDRFIANGERQPTGRHQFDQACAAHHITHRLIKPKHPQTNGMVERFNGRISDVLKATQFNCSGDLRQTMLNYLRIYNYHIPQKALGHIPPIQAMKKWQKERPELFRKQVYDLAGRDR